MMKRFAAAWLLMWGISYIAVAIMAPGIAGSDAIDNRVFYAALGIWVLASVLAFLKSESKAMNSAYHRVSFAVLAIIMVFAGVASWAGTAIWNVPYQNGLAQVSMAFADLISAVFMLYLVLKP